MPRKLRSFARCAIALWFAVICSAAGATATAATPSASHRMVRKGRRPNAATTVVTTTPSSHGASSHGAVSSDLERYESVGGANARPADCDTDFVREGDQIWRIDSHASACTPEDQLDGASGLDFYRLNGQNAWKSSTMQSFSEPGGDPIATVFVIHGNRTTLREARDMLWDVYRHVSWAEKRPLRMVVWTWPSRRTFHRPRWDVRIKAQRSESVGRQLAGVLRRIDPNAPVGLVGFSFGARSIITALDLLGRDPPHNASDVLGAAAQPSRPAPMRALLIAAAIDDDTLLRGHRHDRALSQVDRMMVTVNRCDWLLNAYRRLDYRHGPNALGHLGLMPHDFSDAALEKFEPIDVTNSVGKNHRWPNYMQAPEIIAALREELLGRRQRAAAQVE